MDQLRAMNECAHEVQLYCLAMSDTSYQVHFSILSNEMRVINKVLPLSIAGSKPNIIKASGGVQLQARFPVFISNLD
jgi:hypothetical protein